MLKQKFEVFLLDMYHDGEGWVENSRMSLGTINIPAALSVEDENTAILEALRNGTFTDVTGRSVALFKPGAKTDSLCVEDPYATGDWLEIVSDDDDRCPLYGLSRKETFEEAEPQNTRISYLYKDADNYSKENSAVIAGILSKEDQETILACLDDGEYFIPRQVGLPELRPGPITEADHCWFQLQPGFAEPCSDKPLPNLDAAQLVSNFLAAKGVWRDVAPAGLSSSKPTPVMQRGELFNAILASLAANADEAKHGFWADVVEGEILCKTEEACEAAANFLADVLGESVQTGSYDELDGVPGSGYYITIE